MPYAEPRASNTKQGVAYAVAVRTGYQVLQRQCDKYGVAKWSKQLYSFRLYKTERRPQDRIEVIVLVRLEYCPQSMLTMASSAWKSLKFGREESHVTNSNTQSS